MKNWICGALLMISGITYGQDSSGTMLQGKWVSLVAAPDTIDRNLLQEVVVSAYEQNRKLADVPVAVGVITTAEWNRYNKMSIVTAMNSIPGVRMEERSPGSYRI